MAAGLQIDTETYVDVQYVRPICTLRNLRSLYLRQEWEIILQLYIQTPSSGIFPFEPNAGIQANDQSEKHGTSCSVPCRLAGSRHQEHLEPLHPSP